MIKIELNDEECPQAIRSFTGNNLILKFMIM